MSICLHYFRWVFFFKLELHICPHNFFPTPRYVLIAEYCLRKVWRTNSEAIVIGGINVVPRLTSWKISSISHKYIINFHIVYFLLKIGKHLEVNNFPILLVANRTPWIFYKKSRYFTFFTGVISLNALNKSWLGRKMDSNWILNLLKSLHWFVFWQLPNCHYTAFSKFINKKWNLTIT